MGIVDFHVHGRSSKRAPDSAEDVGHLLRVAELAKVDAVGDMLNLLEPIIYDGQVVERLGISEAYGSNVFYGLHIGVTADREQICGAVEEQQGLLGCLKMGSIDQIESDHAPHLLARKTGEAKDDDGKPIYMSGIPGLDSWPKVIERLRLEGFDEGRIRMLTRDNVLRNYGIPDGVVMDSEGIGDVNLNEYPYGYVDII